MNQIRAILLSGGTGSRMGGDIPKQFLPLIGKPLLLHSVERFKKWGATKSLTVVSHPDWILKTEDILKGILDIDDRIVEGGETRHLSTLAGINSFSFDETDLVCIHDVARPNFRLVELDRLVEETRIYGAATLVAHITESLLHSQKGTNYSEKSLDREEVYSVKTPQMASGHLLKKLLENPVSLDLGKHPTDLASWIQPHKIGLVTSDHTNLKVTHPGDIKLLEEMGLID